MRVAHDSNAEALNHQHADAAELTRDEPRGRRSATEQTAPSSCFQPVWRRVTTVPSVGFIGFAPRKEEDG